MVETEFTSAIDAIFLDVVTANENSVVLAKASMNKIEYRLAALEKFVCAGSDCPANCCRANWKIELEPEIFQQWQALPDAQERDHLCAAVDRYVENGKEVLKMKLDDTGSCVLQTQDHLCSLQQQHGHFLLPGVCQTYPRVWDATGVHAFSSLYLSCPEVARAVLFDVEGPVFRKSAPRQVPLLTADDQIRYALTEMLDRVMTESKYSLGGPDFLPGRCHRETVATFNAAQPG